jgi:hypothetical protein
LYYQIDHGCSIKVILYPSKEYIQAKTVVNAREKNQLTIKERQDILTKDQIRPVNISQKRYEIEQKIEKMIDEPNQMRTFYDQIRNIKTAKRNNFTTIIDNNKCLAKNWDILTKIKHQRLSTSIR